MAKAAIIIPVHNRLDLLGITLRNACQQTERDIEILVVDDHSDEDPAPLVEQVGDSRITFLRSDEKGASAARNLGLSKADSEYAVFLDSDDLLHPLMIERLSAILAEKSHASLAVGQMAHFREDPMAADTLWNTFDPTPFPGKQGTPTQRFLAHEPVWGIHGPLWRRAVLEELGGLDASLPLGQDYELHTRALLSGCQAILVPTILSYVRTHDSISIGSDNRVSRQRILMQLFERLEKMGGSHESIFQGNYLWIAAFAADGGIPDLAHEALVKAKVSGWAGFRFRFALRARVISGRHKFHVMMHDVARELGHDLDARIDWRNRHLIADEPNVEWPPMPPEAWS